MREHAGTKIGHHADRGAEKADTPQETADYHDDNGNNHGPADLIQQKFHIKHRRLAVDQNGIAVHAVDDHAVQFRYEKLEIIYENQRCKTENQNGRILQVVFVNVLSKYHIFSPFLFLPLSAMIFLTITVLPFSKAFSPRNASFLLLYFTAPMQF